MINLITELRMLVVAVLIRCIVVIVPADTQRGRDLIVSLSKPVPDQSAPGRYIVGGKLSDGYGSECHKEER